MPGYMGFRDYSMPEHSWVVIWARGSNIHASVLLSVHCMCASWRAT